MTDYAIEIHGLTKSFGSNQVLNGVSLQVPAGETFAFLGRNGAGKTTTIRMLLGLLPPDAGSVRVLGMDPAVDPLQVRRRVGYLAEDQVMFGWMRVSQMISFTAPFYPTWDVDLARQLAQRFELPLTTRIKHLSKGQNVRLGLLLALAHRPRLAILDDPALGLDPIMRKEFLRDVVTHLQGNQVTVFFSSHLLYEVEPVADQVAILDHGKVLRVAPTETLREQVKRLIFTTESFRAAGNLPTTLDVKHDANQVAVVVEDAKVAIAAARAAGQTPEVVDLNLDEIFEAYVIGKRGGRTAEVEVKV